MAKPSLIFAPGAWYPSTIFDPIITTLKEHGYTNCHTVAFPSVQQASTVKGLEPDIAAVRALVAQEAEAGRDVIVVSHSWSGLPVSSALDGLSKEEREEEGKSGGVVRLVFVASFIPNIGESLIGAFGGTAPPWYVRDEENGTVTASDPYTLFFHDVPDGVQWAAALKPHSWITKNAPSTSAAYLFIPTYYLLCEEDRAIPMAVQQVMVDRARRKGAEIETEKINTGHTPWLAAADEFVAYIRRQAGEEA